MARTQKGSAARRTVRRGIPRLADSARNVTAVTGLRETDCLSKARLADRFGHYASKSTRRVYLGCESRLGAGF